MSGKAKASSKKGSKKRKGSSEEEDELSDVCEVWHSSFALQVLLSSQTFDSSDMFLQSDLSFVVDGITYSFLCVLHRKEERVMNV